MNVLNKPLIRGSKILSLMLCLTLSHGIQADVLDPQNAANPWLDALSVVLASQQPGMDVIRNLNDRSLVRHLDRPRLGAFPDLPAGTLPDSADLMAWEASFAAAEIGALALVPDAPATGGAELDWDRFMTAWTGAEPEDRHLITFHAGDLSLVAGLASAARSLGHNSLVLEPGGDTEAAGRIYVLAGDRLAIDSRAARKLEAEFREAVLLGERLGRDADSLARDTRRERALARNEPAVFRKASLGDENTASTIEEIIVPGGIALGELVEWDIEPSALVFRAGRLHIVARDAAAYALPIEEIGTLRALFDFVTRSEAIHSDAIVDIDGEGRVKISAALRDTDVGYELMRLDTYPFDFVHGLPVTKSVMLDKQVRLQTESPMSLGFATDYEVRFLSADSLRIAQTRVALEYHYDSSTGSSQFTYQWGRDLRRLDEKLDYAGLGESTEAVARYAAWVALFRRVARDSLPFVEGRYEFMKVDNTGRRTPARF